MLLSLCLMVCAFGGIASSVRADAANIVKGDTKENIRIVQQRLK